MNDPLSRSTVARDRSRFTLFSALAISIGACTTSGTVSSVSPPEKDASASAVADASMRDVSVVDRSADEIATSEPSIESEASIDAFDPFGPYDRAIPVRPDAKADVGILASQTDANDGPTIEASTVDAGTDDAADVAPEVGPSLCTTTACIFAAQPAACATCGNDLDRGACLAPPINGDITVLCDGIADITPGRSEAQFCIQALREIIASGCAADGQLTPCLCGDVPPIACQNGSTEPDGPLYDLYADDLSPINRNIADITANFENRLYGVGAATEMIQCLGSYGCRECYVPAPADGGAD